MGFIQACFKPAALALTLTLSGTGAAADSLSGTWTAIIPGAFPHQTYTWHFMPDGKYSEDGQNSETRRPVQQTLHGHWRRQGYHLALVQDDIPYRFEGTVSDDFYFGILYLDGRAFSRFCAMKGAEPPIDCSLS